MVDEALRVKHCFRCGPDAAIDDAKCILQTGNLGGFTDVGSFDDAKSWMCDATTRLVLSRPAAVDLVNKFVADLKHTCKA